MAISILSHIIICTIPIAMLIKGFSQYDEKYRAQYHFSPRKGWVGDPDGLVKYRDTFHLFWWGHATSIDLIHWTEQPYPIVGDPAPYDVNTGSAVIDKLNVAGFGTNSMIGFHTLDNKKEQTIGITYSSDYKNLKLYKGDPILRNSTGSFDFRDPAVFWYKPRNCWAMAVALGKERKIAFYSSVDLKNWNYCSDFKDDRRNKDEIWETPDLFELPVDGNPARKKWVLTIAAGTDKMKYFIGNFDGTTFSNDYPNVTLPLDYGKDFYAARTWRDCDTEPQTRTTIMGWLGSWNYSPQAPTIATYNGRGVESIPRDLALKTFPEGLRLVQTPVAELQQLRQTPVRFQNKTISGTHVISDYGIPVPSANVYELDVVFKVNPTATFGLNLCVGEGRKLVVKYSALSSVLSINRQNCTDTSFCCHFPVTVSANVNPEDRKLRLHIFVDKSSVEVFTNEGKVVLSMLTYPGETQTGIEFFSLNGNTVSDNFTKWNLNSIWR